MGLSISDPAILPIVRNWCRASCDDFCGAGWQPADWMLSGPTTEGPRTAQKTPAQSGRGSAG
jgi:hypothetical protein